MKRKIKLLFTGGHHNSSLATIDWITQNYKVENYDSVEIIWVGKKYVHGTKNLSPEYKEVTKRNIKFLNIHTGKLYRFKSLRYIYMFVINLVLIPIGFLDAGYILMKHKPDLIVSFGGYIAVPLVIVGWLMRIKSVTHEQTSVIGLANSILVPFITRFYVAWPIDYYNIRNQKLLKKTKFVGLPLRESIIKSNKKDLNKLYNFKEINRPVIYITGGKLGSKTINEIVYKSLNVLKGKYNLIWQTGDYSGEFGYEDIFTKLSKYDFGYNDYLVIEKYFDEGSVANVLKNTDIVISRSGAHIVYELAFLNKKSILIPIPWASRDEQRSNANILKSVGLAVILEEKDIDSKKLIDSIVKLLSKDISDHQIIQVKSNAQKEIGKDIFSIFQKSYKT